MSGDTGAGKLALNAEVIGWWGGKQFFLLSTGGELSVLVADTVGNASLNILLKKGVSPHCRSSAGAWVRCGG